MNKLLKSVFFLCLFILVCCSDNSTDSNSGSTMEEPVIPSDLTLQINIIGQTDSFPNGDGSGLITCSANATDAVNYEFRFGSGVTEQSETGQIEYAYTDQGINSYTIYVYAYSSTGHYTSTFYTFDLFVESEAPVATWSEEFNYNGAIDPNIWTHEIGNGEWGWGNGESQYYTSSLDNVRVEDGVLKITAKREDIAGYEYTSARIISRDKYEFKYGRVDIRAKLPTGTGTWPALWLLGANHSEVGWPACGEIDIMEHWGHNPTVISSALHTPSSYTNTVNHAETVVTDYNQEFHVYSMDWNENRIQFLVDNVVFYTYNPSPKTLDNWPFDQDAFFILNVAVGGSWFDIDPEFSESTMEVDYIRIYQ
jgi:hypothetical protein